MSDGAHWDAAEMSAEEYRKRSPRSKYGNVKTVVDGITFDARNPHTYAIFGTIEEVKESAGQCLQHPRRGSTGLEPAMRPESTPHTFLDQTRRIDVTGQKFGRLTALSYQGWEGARKTLWSFRCDCGEVIIRRLATVRRGEIKSCGCLRWLGGYEAPNRKPEGESSFNTLFSHYRRSAADRGHAFELTPDQFRALTIRDCVYCGAPPSQSITATKKGRSNGSYTYTGVDRVDNALGYTPENVVPCCSVCNRAKAAMTETEFIAWVSRAFRHLEGVGRV